MNETKYYCDRCKKEVERGMLTSVKMELDPYSSYKTKRFDKVYQSHDLCADCTVTLGFVLKRPDEKKEVIVEPTIPEKLYDLIADMIREIVR